MMMSWVTEKLLPAMAAAGKDAHIDDLAAAIESKPRLVMNACLRLDVRGLVKRTDKGRYGLTDAGRIIVAQNGGRVRSGPSGPHTGPRRASDNSLRKRLWRALRMAKKATIPELVAIAARGGEKDAAHNARRYLRQLKGAGYVAELRGRAAGTAVQSNGYKRFLLLPDMDTGPEPPVFRPTKNAVYDPNTRAFHPLKEGARP